MAFDAMGANHVKCQLNKATSFTITNENLFGGLMFIQKDWHNDCQRLMMINEVWLAHSELLICGNPCANTLTS